MLTAEKEHSTAVSAEPPYVPTEDLDNLTDDEIRAKLDQLPEVEYPEAFLRELDIIEAEAVAQLASGELVPMTAAEFRAEVMRMRKTK
ncbi:MAG: hypothetical protein LBB74_00340 [Chitinispirillales bacterium]|nr:hypothetical protein [Chitinispirillales bacterium]